MPTAQAQAREEAERLHGPLVQTPLLVTDNGPSFTAKRFVRYTRERFRHVRIAYRTPTQLGLLERFRRTLKQRRGVLAFVRQPERGAGMPDRVQ